MNCVVKNKPTNGCFDFLKRGMMFPSEAANINKGASLNKHSVKEFRNILEAVDNEYKSEVDNMWTVDESD
jgi:hypothetical protein